MQTATTRDQIAKSLMPLVHEVATRVARRLPSHIALDDLVSSGMLGLAGALTRFDPERADTFKGYAEFRIRGAIMDDLRRRDIMSREARIESKRLSMRLQRLNAELGREAEDDEIADYLGVSLDEYRNMQRRFTSVRMVPTDAVELTDERMTPVERVEQGQMREMLVHGIEGLPERMRQVLWMYYYEELPLREIADTFDVTPSRICQIRTEAVELLRSHIAQASGRRRRAPSGEFAARLPMRARAKAPEKKTSRSKIAA